MDGELPIDEGAISINYDRLSPLMQSLASKDFLLGGEEVGIIRIVAEAHSITDPSTPVEMVARALLLLRIATGFVNSNMSEAGIDAASGDLTPMFDGLGIARGFWSATSGIADPRDLWTDVADALDELSTSLYPAVECMHDWRVHSSRGVPVLAEAERIAIWSMSA